MSECRLHPKLSALLPISRLVPSYQSCFLNLKSSNQDSLLSRALLGCREKGRVGRALVSTFLAPSHCWVAVLKSAGLGSSGAAEMENGRKQSACAERVVSVAPNQEITAWADRGVWLGRRLSLGSGTAHVEAWPQTGAGGLSWAEPEFCSWGCWSSVWVLFLFPAPPRTHSHGSELRAPGGSAWGGLQV